MSVVTCCMFEHRPFLSIKKVELLTTTHRSHKILLHAMQFFFCVCWSWGCYHSRWFCFVISECVCLFVWIHITSNCWLLLFQYFRYLLAVFFFSSYKLQVQNNVQHLSSVFLLGVNADFHCSEIKHRQYQKVSSVYFVLEWPFSAHWNNIMQQECLHCRVSCFQKAQDVH